MTHLNIPEQQLGHNLLLCRALCLLGGKEKSSSSSSSTSSRCLRSGRRSGTCEGTRGCRERTSPRQMPCLAGHARRPAGRVQCTVERRACRAWRRSGEIMGRTSHPTAAARRKIDLRTPPGARMRSRQRLVCRGGRIAGPACGGAPGLPIGWPTKCTLSCWAWRRVSVLQATAATRRQRTLSGGGAALRLRMMMAARGTCIVLGILEHVVHRLSGAQRRRHGAAARVR